jgi:TIR domain
MWGRDASPDGITKGRDNDLDLLYTKVQHKLHLLGEYALTSTRKENFLSKLAEMHEATTKGVTNANLRAQFSWNDKTFNNTRQALLDEGRIKKGTGQGGKTILVDTPNAKNVEASKLKVFISYSHQDKTHKLELEKHLKPLERLGLVEKWSDKKIKAGQNLKNEIDANLATANLILLLISIDFVNSHWCFDLEMDEALRRQALNEVIVVPVILRPCLWEGLPFSESLVLPAGGQAVESFSNREDAYLQVAKAIQLHATSFRENGGWVKPKP